MNDYNSIKIDISGNDIEFIRVPSKVPDISGQDALFSETRSIEPVSVSLDNDTFCTISICCTMIICLFLIITRR